MLQENSKWKTLIHKSALLSLPTPTVGIGRIAIKEMKNLHQGIILKRVSAT